MKLGDINKMRKIHPPSYEPNISSKLLLLDLSTFGKIHRGGKDEVAYNLLRGFSDLGYSTQIICTAKEELIETIHKIDPRYTIIPVKRVQFEGRIGDLLGGLTSIFYGFGLRRIIKKANCVSVLFTNKLSPLIRQPVKTWLIPHDIQLFQILEESKGLKSYTRAYVSLIKYNFHIVDKIIAISDFDKQEMIRFLPQYEQKITRIYDPIRFKTVEADLRKHFITALNICYDHKNVITLVKAYALIANSIDEDLVLVGRIEDRPWVKKANEIIEKYHLEKRVRFTGFVSEDTMKNIISATRIFVNPSKFEGFGMVAIEMMENKVPTIVANNTAQFETTIGLCRYYQPATDEKALAKEIMAELTHPTTDQRLDEISKSIKEKYDYKTIAKEYWEKIMLED